MSIGAGIVGTDMIRRDLRPAGPQVCYIAWELINTTDDRKRENIPDPPKTVKEFEQRCIEQLVWSTLDTQVSINELH